MKITIEHSDKSHQFWQDCTVTIPDDEDIHGVMEAVEGCLLGAGFLLCTVLDGFEGRLEKHDYYKEDSDECDTSESL